MTITHLILTFTIFVLYLQSKDMILRIIAVDRACTMLNRICNNRKYSRAVALREIIEGALFQYSNLFGVTVDVDLDDEIQQAKTDDRLLVHMNQRQNIGQNIMRASLHAGIIGNGSKTQVKDPATPNSVFRRMLLKAILACCKQDVRFYHVQQLQINHFISLNIPFYLISGYAKNGRWVFIVVVAFSGNYITRRNVQWHTMARRRIQ